MPIASTPKTCLKIALGAFAAAGAIAAASSASTAQTAPSTAARPIYKDASQPIDRRVEDLLGGMKLGGKGGPKNTTWEEQGEKQTESGRATGRGRGEISGVGG